MKQQLIKVSVVCLALVLIIQCCVFASSELIFAETTTDSYIVITDNDDAAQRVGEIHDVNSESGEALSVNLSEREAVQLKTDKNIVCVEKDFTIENEVEVGWDMVKPAVDDWNMKVINADNASTNSTVKVAILDSGVDYTENILVKERRNFITDDPVTTPLFEDTCGHGTSVASIVAGKGVESNVNGVNGNIELYSARVLDNNKQAPMSRVIEAIYWAMEKKVNIINISFGTQTYSKALKAAIDAATEQGILIIASAGNYGNANIDYPAAFDNVVAVGSINAAGEISDFSSTNEGVDLLAPGEAVPAQANFGEGLTLSGTSLSAPHIAGVAACLWSEDLTKPSTFIKALLKLSAKGMSGADSGYGIVDYEHALQIYDEVAIQFDTITEENSNAPAEEKLPVEEPVAENLEATIEENLPEEKPTVDIHDNQAIVVEVASYDIRLNETVDLKEAQDNNQENTVAPEMTDDKEEAIPDQTADANGWEFEEKVMQEIQVAPNNSIIEDYSDPVVTGSWKASVHQKYYANASMKAGAVISDNCDVKGMTTHQEFHGFSWHASTDSGINTGTCNYIANYKYLVLVANKVGSNGAYTSVKNSDVIGLSSTCYGKLQKGVGIIMKTSAYKNAASKKAFLTGVAMHAATDAFAHSAFKLKVSGWERIKHNFTTNVDDADDPTYYSRRVQMAYAVEKNVVSRYNGNRSGEKLGNDFHDDTGSAYIPQINFGQNKLYLFAKAADVTKNIILTHFRATQGVY